MVHAKDTKEMPATAVEVKVTNVCSPSFMKIYEKDDEYTDRLNEISGKLRLLTKKQRVIEYDSKVVPCIEDQVIVHGKIEADSELPVHWARGVLGHYNKTSLKYNVFLVDHGYVVQVRRFHFTVVNKRLLHSEHLTCSVGINNLIPAVPKRGEDIDLRSPRRWSELAIKITRNCISASSETYFDHQATAENGVKYGELYLTLTNEIVSLSEILTCKGLAISLTEDLYRLIESPHYDTTTRVNSVDGGIFFGPATESLESMEKHRELAEERNRRESYSGMRFESSAIESTGRRAVTSMGNETVRYLVEECQKILVRSNIHCERLIFMADARFPVYIHKALHTMSVVAFGRLQSYMCSAVAKGLNVLAVGPPVCGKTLGYLMPILSNIALCEEVPKGIKPVILILCSSTSNVLHVKNICSDLLECYTDIRCVAAFNGRPNRSLVSDIYNGCQILIATPPFLMRFMNQDDEHKKLLNFEDLTQLVIDDIDVILDKYYESFQKFFAKHIVKPRTENSRNSGKPPMQIVAASRHWSSLLNEFAKQCMTDPYVCIGSYMEAAIFGRIKPKLYIVNAEKKMQKLKSLLGDQTSMTKTLIICQDNDEVRALNEFLSPNYKILAASENMIFTEIEGIGKCWKAAVSGLYPILICTDEVLVNLDITDVDWLIHYSIALPSKTQFYFRFSTLMKNLEKGNGKSRVTILSDETNDVQLLGVVSVLKRCGIKLSAEFEENVMRIVATLDSCKKMYPICDNVKAFGYCPKKTSCTYRHCALASVDTPVTPIKIGDSVKLRITFVHNVTHFTARVIEYIDPADEVTEYSQNDYTQLSTTIQTYYSNKNNRRCRKGVKVGDICALEASLDDFQRVKVLNVVHKDFDGNPIAVELKCVDTGQILSKISVTRLMEIPEDLAKRDTHIAEVFLAGLAPYDDEYEWNNQAFNDVFQWIQDNNQPLSYILGKVCLHVADTLWVDPLEFRTKIIGHPDLVSASLKSHMIRLKHAVPSEKHLSQLYELCEIGRVRNAVGESIVPSNLH